MDENWVDVTVVGSEYEEQLEIYSNKRRYRPLKIGRVLHLDKPTSFEERGIGEWRHGNPPNVKVRGGTLL
jgi:hypothetical protein